MKKKGLFAVLLSAVLSAVLFLCAAIRPTAVGSTDDTKPVKAIFEGAKIIIQKEVIVYPDNNGEQAGSDGSAQPYPMSADISIDDDSSSGSSDSAASSDASSDSSSSSGSSSSSSSDSSSSSGSSSSSSGDSSSSSGSSGSSSSDSSSSSGSSSSSSSDSSSSSGSSGSSSSDSSSSSGSSSSSSSDSSSSSGSSGSSSSDSSSSSGSSSSSSSDSSSSSGSSGSSSSDSSSSSGSSGSSSSDSSSSSGSSSSSSSDSSSSSGSSSSSSSDSSSSDESSGSSSSSSSDSGSEPEKVIIEEIVDAPDKTVYYDNLTEAIEDIEAAGAKEAVVILDDGAVTDEPYSTVTISSGSISLFLNGGRIGADIKISEKALLVITDDDSFPTISLTNGTFSVDSEADYFEITSSQGAGISVPAASRDFALVTEDISYIDDPETADDESAAIRKTFVFRDFTPPVKILNAYYYRYESSRVTSKRLLINKSLPKGISEIKVEVLRVPENGGFSLRDVATNEKKIKLSAAAGMASAANGVNSAGTARDYYFGEPLIHLAVADSESENYLMKDSDGNIMKARAFCPDYLYALSGNFTLTDVVWNMSSGHRTNVFAGSKDISVSYTAGSTSEFRTWFVEGKQESEDKKVYWLCDEDGIGNFYTTDEAARDGFIEEGFEDRGVAWIAPIKSDKPVYVVFNENDPSEFFYTTDKNEYNTLINAGWKRRGIAFYASTETNMYPIYRQYNKRTGRHNFTSSTHEKNVLVSEYGWSDEGVAWYASDLLF